MAAIVSFIPRKAEGPEIPDSIQIHSGPFDVLTNSKEPPTEVHHRRQRRRRRCRRRPHHHSRHHIWI